MIKYVNIQKNFPSVVLLFITQIKTILTLSIIIVNEKLNSNITYDMQYMQCIM